MQGLFNKKVTISYYAEGSRNDLGEPSRTLTERDSDVPCRLEPRSQRLSYEFPQRILRQRAQGLVDLTTFIITLSAGQTIQTNDIVTDSDSVNYTVAAVNIYGTHHKEGLLSRISGK